MSPDDRARGRAERPERSNHTAESGVRGGGTVRAAWKIRPAYRGASPVRFRLERNLPMTHPAPHASPPGDRGSSPSLSRSRASRPDRDEARISSAPRVSQPDVLAELEDERFHPSIGQSWAPPSRDDHVRGLRHSVPDGLETGPVATTELPAEPSFFGMVSTAFGAATSHSRRGSEMHHPAAAAPPSPRPLLDTEPDPTLEEPETQRESKR